MREVFDRAGGRGFVHAREVDGPGEVCLDADDPVVLASVFKIPIVLEYARQAAAGELDRTERITVTAADRDGGIGVDGCSDDVSLTLRDLAHLMMTLSDNACTDVLLRRVGLERVHATLAGLGLRRTRLIGGCKELFQQVRDEVGDIAEEDLTEAMARPLAVRDPGRTTSSTPREITSLLSRIWRDEAGPAEACAEVRRIMGNQVWPHRMSSGFPDGVKVSGKTGTLWGVRNEAGVVEFPDGGRYAVAVFVRTSSLGMRHPAADAAIGRAARIAVDRLRA
ncbi:class A beta-lactamase-related serine hydrolase [Nonomuraea sp. NBC_01738]|uniref:serine hydrolase n=1 Tax=Nonomuraea sp. NBC_01738 TaxID=2976003 RepID=UPI002E114A1E|nr:class A beta-lactamase-related serine hydrolase [Nonomuraea sp. NBC_01738]